MYFPFPNSELKDFFKEMELNGDSKDDFGWKLIEGFPAYDGLEKFFDLIIKSEKLAIKCRKINMNQNKRPISLGYINKGEYTEEDQQGTLILDIIPILLKIKALWYNNNIKIIIKP